MMIDFAAAEREQGMSPRDALSSGLSAAFSTDSDDHAGGVARGIAIMLVPALARNCTSRVGDRGGCLGGLLVSGVLCLPHR